MAASVGGGASIPSMQAGQSSGPADSAILLFYHYEALQASSEVIWQRELLESLRIGGRLRVAPSGLNGTLSGRRSSLEEYAAAIVARHAGAHAIDFKYGAARDDQMFDSLSVRAVDEVVSLGVAESDVPLEEAGRHVSPREFHELLRATASPASSSAEAAPVVLLDARNVYESRIGHFQVAGVPTMLPQTRQFTDLPAYLDARLEELRGRTVLMYCTGGVRCEPASAYLRHRLAASGYAPDATEVLQLAGGIERYMSTYPDGGFFRGKNLVFDKRLVTAPPSRVAPDVVGRCWLCAAPTDDYGPQRRCCHCRLLLLLCPACCEVHPQGAPSLTCGACDGARKAARRDVPDTAPTPPPPEGALPQRANRRTRRATAVVDAPAAAASPEAPVASSSLPVAPDWASADATVKHEYLDHTADVQIHSWGATLEEAFEQQVVGVMGLITELATVQVPSSREVVAEGHDLHSLLYNFLDEWLFQFNAEYFVCRRVKVTSFDRERWRIVSTGCGEAFELGRHPQGIEVKAITYSAMRVTEDDGRVDVLVIVDI